MTTIPPGGVVSTRGRAQRRHGPGGVHEPAVVAAQVKRMLADPKAEQLVHNFAGQWLSVRDYGSVQPAAEYKDYDSILEQASKQEPYAFFAEVLGKNLPVTSFLASDFVVVNERQRADNGEMVIAMLHGNSATVKKFYRERDGRIRLQPANETMAPIYVHENDITIQGIVVGVMRRY